MPFFHLVTKIILNITCKTDLKIKKDNETKTTVSNPYIFNIVLVVVVVVVVVVVGGGAGAGWAVMHFVKTIAMHVLK